MTKRQSAPCFPPTIHRRLDQLHERHEASDARRRPVMLHRSTNLVADRRKDGTAIGCCTSTALFSPGCGRGSEKEVLLPSHVPRPCCDLGIELFLGARLHRDGTPSRGEGAARLFANRVYPGLFDREGSGQAHHSCFHHLRARWRRDIKRGGAGEGCSWPRSGSIDSGERRARIVNAADRRGSTGGAENWKHVMAFLDNALLRR